QRVKLFSLSEARLFFDLLGINGDSFRLVPVIISLIPGTRAGASFKWSKIVALGTFFRDHMRSFSRF
ncbi:MAG: hypothetical protein AAFQ89_16005, partial [Cyanobacteria bacterium J06626_18]